MIFMFGRLLFLGLLVTFTVVNCKRRQDPVAEVKSGEGSNYANTLSGFSAEQKKAWNPCGDAVDRLSTRQLEQHLKQYIKPNQTWADKREAWPSVIDLDKAGEQFRDPNLAARGGFFGTHVDELPSLTQPGQMGRVVHDNLMRYSWSLDGNGEFIRDASKGFAHVIRQRNGPDQPEMLRYVKDGDIIVYFHPERRRGLSSLQQWRATHAATIMEVPSEEGALPCKLTTADTPSGYARPFNGSSTTPFHVFRPVYRQKDAQGKYLPYDEELNYWKRTQISRYASLAFDKFGFNGDYNSMTVKAPSDLDIFEQAFIKQRSIPNLYCAWFVFTNANLGMTRPMKFDSSPPRPVFNGSLQQSHMYGNGKFNDFYALPRSVTEKYGEALARRNDFFIDPMVGPELAMGFLDRIIGPDKHVPTGDSDSPLYWEGHVKTKIMLINQLRPQLEQLYNVRGNIQGLNPGALFQHPDGISPEEISTRLAQKYNERIITFFDKILKIYQNSIQPDVLANMNRVQGHKGYIRKTVRDIITAERTGTRESGVYRVGDTEYGTVEFPVFGRKWIPPYGYARVAENHEAFYLPTTNREDEHYKPQLVYVGSVIHQKYLQNIPVEPVAATRELDSDRALKDTVRQRLEAKGVTTTVDLSLDMLTYLKSVGPEKGLNEFEHMTLMTQKSHWGDSEVLLHNKYGIDPVLMLRSLANYWNNPYLLRPAIYEGPESTTSLEGATENIRLLMMDPVIEMAQDPHGIDEREQSMHPRRRRPLQCSDGEDPQNFKCRG
jgi:hypothetical protein